MMFSHIANALLNSMWQSCLLAACAWVGLRLHSRSSAALGAAVWSAALLGMALLPLADYVVSRTFSSVAVHLAQRGVSAATPYALAKPATSTEFAMQGQAAVSNMETTASETATSEATPSETPFDAVGARALSAARMLRDKTVRLARRGRQALTDAHTATIRLLSSAATIFVSIWLLVAAVLSARLGFRVLRLYRLKRSLVAADIGDFGAHVSGWRSLPSRALRSFSIGTSTDVPTPCVLGFLHPAIALPAFVTNDLSQSDRERIVLHERAHVQRFDDWSKLAQQIVEATLWFNPCIYMVGQLLDTEREIACDDYAATLDGNVVTYAQCLTNLASRRVRFARYYPVAGFVIGRKQLIVRIERLLEDRHVTSTQLGRLARLLVVLLVVCSLSAAWIQTPLVAAGIAPLWQQAPVANPLASASPRQTDTSQYSQDARWDEIGTVPAATASARPAGRAAPAVLAFVRRIMPPTRPKQNVVPSNSKAGQHGPLGAPSASNRSGVTNVSEDNFIEQLNQLGYGSLQLSDILELRRHHISTDFIRAVVAAEMQQPDVQTLIDLYSADVTPSAVSNLRALGYRNLALRDLIEAHTYAIAPSYLRGLAKTGYTGLSISDVQELHYSAVPFMYLATVHSAGMSTISASQAAELYANQVPADFVVGIARVGYQNLGVDDVLTLHRQGVLPNYIVALKRAGYGRLSPAELETFKEYSVDPVYAGALARMNYKNLSAQELSSLSEHGITPSYIARLRKANPRHKAAYTLDELMNLPYAATP